MRCRGAARMDVREEKKRLRAQMIQVRDNISEREEKSRRIAESFLQLREAKEAESFFCYVSFRSEVDTIWLLDRLWKAGKRVAVPKTEGKQMNFYEIRSMEDLSPGYCAILEPKPEMPRMCRADILIMPGLAFDVQGHRIGYGGGFYDRFLERHFAGKKIALAFEEQIQETIPSERRDAAADGIVTDRRILWIS